MYRLALILLISVSAFAKDANVRGIVVDSAGAVVQNARVRLLYDNGHTAAEVSSDKNGKFELNSPAGEMTVVVFASGFAPYRKDLGLSDGSTIDLHVKLTVGCSGELAKVPKNPDLRTLLIEIHHSGSFGCPEAVYRLWGTGDASARYVDCRGKAQFTSRHIDAAELQAALGMLSNTESGPVCDYYPGGVDAPRVELTVVSSSQPRVVTSHDEADNVGTASSFEQQIEKLIDPERKIPRLQRR